MAGKKHIVTTNNKNSNLIIRVSTLVVVYASITALYESMAVQSETTVHAVNMGTEATLKLLKLGGG
jgi:hypothetical protein